MLWLRMAGWRREDASSKADLLVELGGTNVAGSGVEECTGIDEGGHMVGVELISICAFGG